MRKLLLLLVALLAGVSGAWATTYVVSGRASSLTTGKQYMIYNTARRYFLSSNGAGYAITANTTPLSFTTTSSAYIWTLETGTEDGTFKIKNNGSSTYSAGGTSLGSAVDYTIAEFSGCPSKGGMASYNDDGTTKASTAIVSSDNTVYIVQYGTTAYWNGTESNFNTHTAAHVYVLYEVSEIADNKCYSIHTETRGYLAVKSGGASLVGNLDEQTPENQIAFVEGDAQFHFGFVTYSNKNYLYNVGASKFVKVDGTLADVPDLTNDAVTVEASNYSGYPIGLRFYEGGETPQLCLNLGGSYQVAIDTWGATWGTFGEDGNAWVVEEADDFDPTSAILNIAGNDPNVYNSWNISSADLSTNFWTAMGGSTPDAVTALGSSTPYYRTRNFTLTDDGSVQVYFKYTSGTHKLRLLGVDLLDGSDNIVASDYHSGETGSSHSNNSYVLNSVPAGSYKLRYIINGESTTSSQGSISVNTIKYADSYTNISQWYVMRVHSNQAHYMYYDSSNESTGISFTESTSDISTDNYLWGFVKNSDGVQIFNKGAGDDIALDNATPSKLSADGKTVKFKLGGSKKSGSHGEEADAFFTIYQTAGTYLNYQSSALERWDDNDEGSTFMVYEVDAPATLSYTFTDENGATYSGTYTGMAGVTEPPTVPGCNGYTLSNKEWTSTTFTAEITFPFPVSSNSLNNATTLRSALGNSLWYANNGAVIADNEANTHVYDTNADNYRWYIYPVFSAGAFSFKIYNVGAAKYIPNNPSNDSGVTTTLTEDDASAGAFRFSAYNKGNGFYDVTTSKFLTINTSGTGQNIWLWEAAANTQHTGSVMSFPDLVVTNVSTTFAALKGATKFDILDGSTVMGPNELAAPAEINTAIDAAQEVADNTDAKIAFIESANGTKIQNYLNKVAEIGSLATVQITMNKEYGTMILPCPCTRIDGLDIYSCSAEVDGVLTLTPVEGNYSQNVPYIIHATEGNKYTLIGWDKGSTSTHTSGWLTGVLNSTTDIPSGSYMLATNKSTGVQAFYQVSGSGVKCAINKCYLTVPAAGVKAFFFDEDGKTTAIEEIFGGKTEQGVIYNLAGQRLNKAQKGINIINGKKIIK